MIKPWSSRPSVIDVVLEFFDATTKCLDELPAGSEHMSVDNEPKSQLPELAGILLACFQERLDWLQRQVILLLFIAEEFDKFGMYSPAAADEAGVERDRDELERKFGVLRPEVFETLRKSSCKTIHWSFISHSQNRQTWAC
jgi:nuclear pore complex protein Nup133